MGLPKGRTNNPKGRPKKPNKITTQTRVWLQNLIDANREQLELDLKSLEPKDRWNIIERLMQYTTPKMQSIDASVQFDRLSEDHINTIVSELLKSIHNDTTK